MSKRFLRVLGILLLFGGFAGGSWLLNRYSYSRVCDKNQIYPIDLEMLQPITQQNLKAIQRLKIFSGYFFTGPDIEFNPTSQSVAIMTLGSRIHSTLPYHPVLWHFADGCIQTPGDITRSIGFLGFSQDGQFYLVTDCLFNCYALYSVNDGRLVDRFYKAQFITLPSGEGLAYQKTENHDRELLNLENMQVFPNGSTTPYHGALLFSLDFRFFIASDSQGVLWLRDSITGVEVHEFVDNQDHSALPEVLQFSSDGRWLISKYRMQPLHVWNTETGELQLIITEESVWQDKWALGRNSKQLLYGHYIWDLETRSPNVYLDGSTFEMLSPDGSFFSTIKDETVLFWDEFTAEAFFKLDFDELVSDVSISPNQKLLAITTLIEGGNENVGLVELWGIPVTTSLPHE